MGPWSRATSPADLRHLSMSTSRSGTVADGGGALAGLKSAASAPPSGPHVGGGGGSEDAAADVWCEAAAASRGGVRRGRLFGRAATGWCVRESTIVELEIMAKRMPKCIHRLNAEQAGGARETHTPAADPRRREGSARRSCRRANGTDAHRPARPSRRGQTEAVEIRRVNWSSDCLENMADENPRRNSSSSRKKRNRE